MNAKPKPRCSRHQSVFAGRTAVVILLAAAACGRERAEAPTSEIQTDAEMQAAQRRAGDELGSFAREFGAQPYSFPEFALETVYSLESEKAIENLGGLVAARSSVLDVTRSGETYTVILGPQFGSGYLASLACTREQAEQLVAAPKDVRAGGYLVVARIENIGRVPLVFEAEEGTFHVSVNKSDAPMLYKGTLVAIRPSAPTEVKK